MANSPDDKTSSTTPTKSPTKKKDPEQLKKERADVDESGAKNIGTVDKKKNTK